MNITFIGGGNMATAIIGGLRAAKVPLGTFCVVDPVEAACERLRSEYHVDARTALWDAARSSDVIVLAVKPQQMREAAQALGRCQALVVSIAAGIRAADLARWLGAAAEKARIIRCMPNTPALVHAGVTALYAAAGASAADRQQAESLMQAVGRVVWVDKESDLDAVTGLSGSGPAYVFYFIEALEAAAIARGLPAATARTLALETIYGAAKLARESSDDPATLRAKVTSKKGTTEQGLLVLESRGLPAIVSEAVAAATRRSAELGDEFGRG